MNETAYRDFLHEVLTLQKGGKSPDGLSVFYSEIMNVFEY
jgi:hypothetical protein